MRTYQPNARRPLIPAWVLGGLAFVLLIGGGVLATLWLVGVNLNPFRTAVVEDAFMVRIPINSKPIPAYTRVDRMQMVNPTTGGLMYQKLPPASVVGMSITGIDSLGSQVEGRIEAVKRQGDEVVFVVAGGKEVRQSQAIDLGGAMMNINGIIGRVVKRDKRAGLGFREDNFFPQGTPEGIAGATPEGMRAMTLDATKLVGVHALNAGDQIDLLATVSAESLGLEVSPRPISRGKGSAGDSPGEPVMLAQSAVVLKPVYVRTEAATSASLTQGTRVQSVPKYEVAIAVKPDDIIPVQSAVNQSLPITCIVHPMRPVGSDQSLAPAGDPNLVAVPVTARTIYAYNVVSRDAFISRATRSMKTEMMSRQQVARLGIVTSLDQALGTIARHDIPAGRFLRLDDLLSGPPATVSPPREVEARRQGPQATLVSEPDKTVSAHRFGFLAAMQSPEEESEEAMSSATAVGDRPAVTRFIPAGRTAIAIPWNRVYASEHLQIGDRIDLMASYDLQSTGQTEQTETRPDGTTIVRRSDSLIPQKTDRTSDESFGFRAEPWFVATDAVVIAPVGFPAPASALRALGESANRQSATSGESPDGPPIIIAVDDRDAEPLATVLATRDAVFTIAFRGSENSVAASPPGTKQVVVMSQPLIPYREFSESHWKGNRRRVDTRMVSDRDPRFESAITIDEIDGYYGRIIARPKARGDHLTADDFLPVGSATGLASGGRRGHSLFAVADREIEGLDSFETEDRVAILTRGVVNPPEGTSVVGVDFKRAISSVVVQDVRIVRRSLAGQTVLELANADLAALQAAIAESLTTQDARDARSHLVAVALPRGKGQVAGDDSATDVARDVVSDSDGQIPSFDPLGNVEFTDLIIGRERTRRAFIGAAR